MLSDSSNNFHEIEALHIKHDNKLFTRLMSKETSFGNSSSMVYYGGASGSIPFVWESHPGTPKHPSSDTTLPPLTPPPSYHHSTFKSNPKPKAKPMPKTISKSTLFGSIFRKLNTPRENHASSSLSSFSSWSSSLHCSGSGSSSVSSFMNRKMFHRRRGYFSCSRSPVHNCMDDYDDDDDDEGFGSSTSRLCFGVKVKQRNLNEFGGCQSMMNMKKALPSFVSHD